MRKIAAFICILFMLSAPVRAEEQKSFADLTVQHKGGYPYVTLTGTYGTDNEVIIGIADKVGKALFIEDTAVGRAGKAFKISGHLTNLTSMVTTAEAAVRHGEILEKIPLVLLVIADPNGVSGLMDGLSPLSDAEKASAVLQLIGFLDIAPTAGYLWDALDTNSRKAFVNAAWSDISAVKTYSAVKETLLEKLIVYCAPNLTWGELKTFLIEKWRILEKADADSAGYGRLSETSKSQVFKNMLSGMKNLSSAGQMVTLFNKEVSALAKETGGSPAGGGGGGSNGTQGSLEPSLLGKFGFDENSTGNSDSALKFSDLSDVPWAKEAILALAAAGIVSGYPDGTFRPDQEITRAELVALLLRIWTLPNMEAEVDFYDNTPGAWYYGVVRKAAANGLLQGYEGFVEPERAISRQDMAVLIKRMLDKVGISLEEAEQTDAFGDDNQISDYAKESVYWLKRTGITVGTEKGFEPLAPLTRAQAAVLLYRCINY